jgi:predicted nucleotidyltransferase
VTILDKHINDIKKLCLTHNVRQLYAFGSVLTNKFTNDSDIDLIVDFEPIDLSQYADNYYDFKFSLENVLQKRVDLLEDKAIKNPYFREAVDKQRQLIYGY